MGSKFVVTSVEKLQKEVNLAVASFKTPGIFVSLNKSAKSAESIFKKAKINTSRLFFIDCVSNEHSEAIHVEPNNLDELNYIISTFIREIKGNKFLVIDSLATLLLYNDENKIAKFVKKVTSYASRKGVEIVALSQKTAEENLLNKIFNFFDTVKKK